MARIAQRTLAKREAGYASEVRRLLDAALEVGKISGYRWQRTPTPAEIDHIAASCLRTVTPHAGVDERRAT